MPLAEHQKKEIELLGERKWFFNSKGQKFYCIRNPHPKGGPNGLPALVQERNMKPGMVVTSLPSHLIVYELLNGWVKFYKKK